MRFATSAPETDSTSHVRSVAAVRSTSLSSAGSARSFRWTPPRSNPDGVGSSSDFTVSRDSSSSICCDLRGIGYSDQFTQVPTVDDWVVDAIAVLDAVGVDQVAVVATGHGGLAGVQLAARHPERVSRLVLANTFARSVRADDYPLRRDSRTGS